MPRFWIEFLNKLSGAPHAEEDVNCNGLHLRGEYKINNSYSTSSTTIERYNCPAPAVTRRPAAICSIRPV